MYCGCSPTGTDSPEDLSILYSNRAACSMKDGNSTDCIQDCTKYVTSVSFVHVRSLVCLKALNSHNIVGHTTASLTKDNTRDITFCIPSIPFPRPNLAPTLPTTQLGVLVVANVNSSCHASSRDLEQATESSLFSNSNRLFFIFTLIVFSSN